MFSLYSEALKNWSDQVTKFTEPFVAKVEEILSHPEVGHLVDLVDAIADKNVEIAEIIGQYGTALVSRISTRNEPKS